MVEFLQLIQCLEDSWLFICCLSVALWQDKGDFPENLHTVRLCLNKRLFELFCVWIKMLETSGTEITTTRIKNYVKAEQSNAPLLFWAQKCMCVHAFGRVCRKYIIYIIVEVLCIHLLLLIVQSVVCSPLLVRHHAIEKTTVIIITSAQSVQD